MDGHPNIARVEAEAELAALRAASRVLRSADPDEWMRRWGAGDTFGEDPSVTAARRAALDARAEGFDASAEEEQYRAACLVVAHRIQHTREVIASAIASYAERSSDRAETSRPLAIEAERTAQRRTLARTGVVHAGILAARTRTQRAAAAHKAAA